MNLFLILLNGILLWMVLLSNANEEASMQEVWKFLEDGNVEELNKVFELGSVKLNEMSSTENSKNPLMYAVEKENLELTEVLLKNHADPNVLITAENGQSTSPIHYAAEKGLPDLMTLLVKYHANYNMTLSNENQEYPIHIVAKGPTHEHVSTAAALLYEKPGDGSDEAGTSEEDLEKEEKELEIQLSQLEARTIKQKKTPLMIAASSQNLEMLIMMISSGSDLDAVDYEGNTALHLASRDFEDVLAIVELLEAGSNVNITNNFGETAEDLAKKNSHFKLEDLNIFQEFLHGPPEEEEHDENDHETYPYTHDEEHADGSHDVYPHDNEEEPEEPEEPEDPEEIEEEHDEL